MKSYNFDGVMDNPGTSLQSVNLAPPRPSLFTRPLFAWAMYDWANSAYSTFTITIVPIYVSKFVFPEADWGRWSGAAFPFLLSFAAFLGAIMAPLIGAMADARASKAKWLLGTAFLGSAFAVAMGLLPTESTFAVAACFVGMAISFELSYGMYNAFLPELADEERMNRVSAFGFACGYVGGGLALLAMVAIAATEKGWGWSDTSQLRTGMILLGLWWGGFSLPALLWLRDRALPRNSAQGFVPTARQAFREVRGTLVSLRLYRLLATFLIGYLFYNDCIQTVITNASLFAEKDLKFTTEDLIKLVLMIQFVALLGSIPCGWLADHWGAKRTLIGCLLIWAALIVSSLFVKEQSHFWAMGFGVALVLGGTQAVSRGIMATMTPPAKTAEFFGFFNLSSKAMSFLGPLIFGGVYLLTGEYRTAILSLIVLLAIGFAFVLFVDVDKGRQEALAAIRNPGKPGEPPALTR